MAGERTLKQVDRVAETLATQGFQVLKTPSFRRCMGRGGGPGPMIEVFDEGGREVTGLRGDPEARRLASKALEQGEVMTQRRGVRHLTARPLVDSDGHRFVVVGTFLRHPSPVDLLEPGILVPRLILLALVAALLVWWMARRLSAPVAALRTATGALASGDLGARVGPEIGARRDEFGQLARDFDGMAEHVERLVENQRRLIGDVSHELRSPLARLNVALALARRKADTDEEDALDRVELESARLEDLISRLLEFTRLERGPVERSPIDLVALIEAVVADAGYENSGNGIRFDLPEVDEISVMGDAGLLRSALENVIRNAVFFSGKGAQVEIDVEVDADDVRIRVADRGPGVPEEDLMRIFEVFYRVGDARERAGGGSGLGLAIAARAVERHGGTIIARNREGGGLVVEIAIPD
jgi:two-component system sensor histidine kinase CpxA